MSYDDNEEDFPLLSEKWLKYLREEDEYLDSLEESKSEHVRATPLVEVLSVRIYSNDKKPSQVYGTVEVIDGEGATLDLYNRKEEENADELDQGGFLTLTFAKGRVINPFYEVVLKMDIKDKTRNNAGIANGELIWNYRYKDDYDKVQIECVNGQCGYAAVEYITYRYAVIATLDIFLLKDAADVYGKIVAHRGNTCSVLFETTLDKPARVVKDGSISLSRHVVVVPAYCDLVIEADLWNRGTEKQICHEDFKSQPFDHFNNQTLEGPSGRIKVVVHWSHLYMQPPPKRNRNQKVEEASGGVNLECKKLLRAWDQPPLSPLHQPPSRNIGPHSVKELSSRKVEDCPLVLDVFSVVAVSDNGEGFHLWGTIKVGGEFSEYLIFDKEKTSAVKLLSNQTVPLIAPTYLHQGRAFNVKTKLKDAEDRIISMGFANWTQGPVDLNSSFYNKPLCSVIRGDIGYAVVHYALFTDGWVPEVKVGCSHSKSSSTNLARVHGSVFAQHTKFKYVTPYEKEHYRNKLFERPPENPELITTSEFELPLSKSMVAVPLDSSLTVDLDLTVSLFDSQTQVVVHQQRLTFCPPADSGRSVDTVNVGAGQYPIYVTVAWGFAKIIKHPKSINHPIMSVSLVNSI